MLKGQKMSSGGDNYHAKCYVAVRDVSTYAILGLGQDQWIVHDQHYSVASVRVDIYLEAST